MPGPKDMMREARRALRGAYAPYSGIHVGAAVLAGRRTYSGCNIENASYGLSVCAERVAVFKAVSEGRRSIRAVVITSDAPDNLMPCGACLQVISEFAEDDGIPIIVGGPKDEPHRYTLEQLLPGGVRLKRTVAKATER
jgi:cytidine deaminase